MGVYDLKIIVMGVYDFQHTHAHLSRANYRNVKYISSTGADRAGVARHEIEVETAGAPLKVTDALGW